VHVLENKLHVENLVKQQFSKGFNLSKLKLFNPDHFFFILPPKDSEEANHPLHPSFLAIRFEYMIAKQEQKEIVKA
jgi:hypothetical protein